MKILITGSCGFIGSHLSEHLLLQNNTVIGIDNLNSFIYEPKHKELNLNSLIKLSLIHLSNLFLMIFNNI